MKISLITVSLNSGNLIENTIKSIINQDYAPIEYIVIDGGSTDNSLNIIQQYREKIAIVISEKDNGIYDAMNKGLSHATGDLIYFLNSGDTLYNRSVLQNSSRVAEEHSACGIFIGDTYLYGSDLNERIQGYRRDEIDYLGRVVNHQAIIARKSVFNTIGGFDTKYKIYADYDWLLKAIIKYRIKVHYTPIPIAYYLKGGISDAKWRSYVRERREILQKYSSNWQILRYFLRYPKDLFQYLYYRIV